MDTEKLVKESQEQAVASWINYLNQIRLNELLSKLQEQDINLSEALETLNNSLTQIHSTIISGRGGDKGIHGFIAEIAECGVGNAREQINGNNTIYEWLDDNGISDLKRGSTYIQQKFYESDGMFSLGAVSKHFHKYPDYLNNGAKYQIPKDQYENVKFLHSLSEKEAYKKLSNSSGTLTLRQWRKVNEFFKNENIKFEDLEPSQLDYSDVQRDTIDKTINVETENIKNIDKERRNLAYNESKPTLKEGAKATVVSATIEGGTTLVLEIANKIKAGKSIKDFDENDWKEIFNKSGMKTLEGGIRGASIYMLTNFTATPSAVASAMVTASFGIAEQAHKLRINEITETEFTEKSQLLCVDASVSALSSLIGQALIPIPVIGAVIGNTIGAVMYQISKDNFAKRECELLEECAKSIQNTNKKLDEQYQEYIVMLSKELSTYMELLKTAFSPDIETAFNGSIELAKKLGVSHDKILDTYEKGLSYFTE